MPRFFFTVKDNHEGLDRMEVELEDVHIARMQAVRAAGEMIRDKAGDGVGIRWQMDVVDEAGQVIFTLKFTTSPIKDS